MECAGPMGPKPPKPTPEVICVVTNAKLSTVGCTQYGEKQTPCSSVRTSLRLNMIAAGVHTNDIGLSEYI